MFASIKRLAACALFALVLATTGCVDYEKQTAVFVFPKDGKTVEGLIVYEGIHLHRAMNCHTPADNLKRAKNDLQGIINGDILLLGNSAIRVPLKADATFNAEEKEAYKVVGQHVKSRPGFFVKANGKLNYCQPLTIHEPQRAVAHLNNWISAKLMEDGALTPEHEPALQAARKGHEWVKVEPGKLSLSLPGSRGVMDKLLKEVNGDSDWAKTLAANSWNINHHADHLTLSLGVGNGQPVRLISFGTTPTEIEDGDRELARFATTLNVPTRDDVSLQDVLHTFERTGKLPR